MSELWDKYARPPKEVLKEFKKAGGFTGTSIDPMWFYRCATKEWGEYGTDWSAKIITDTVVREPEGTLHYMVVEVKGSIGVGCTLVRSQNKNGWYVDEEAPKKTFTDAVTNALSKKGFGHAIYMGQWDGSKYKDEPRDTPGLPLPPTDPASSAAHARAEKARAEMARAVNPLEIPESWSEKARDAFRTLFNRGVDVISKAGGDDFRTRAVRAFYAFDPPPLSLSELEPGEMEEYYDAVELMINNIQERMS